LSGRRQRQGDGGSKKNECASQFFHGDIIALSALREPNLGSRLRAEFWRSPTGLRVLNDSYNANPDSVTAALRTLAGVDAPRRVAVLGEMAELGEASGEAHRRMGELAGSLGIEVLAVGTPAYGGTVVADQDEALAVVRTLPAGSAILVKASRSVGLDRLADALRAEEVAAR